MPSIELPAEPAQTTDEVVNTISGDARELASVEPIYADLVESTVVFAGASPETLSGAARRAWYWRWIDNRVALLGILFLVTGAFGLPLLYHSRAFSTRTKWMVALANVVYTVVSCYWAYLEIASSVATIREALLAM